MSTKKIIILSCLSLILISILYDNFYTVGMISGKYVYKFPLSRPEGPREGDKLQLNKDGTFQSDSWGEGTYKIVGSALDLTYHDQLGRAGYQMTIYRPFFWGIPKICVDRDLNYCFEKRKY